MSRLLTDSEGALQCHLHDSGHNGVTGVLTQPNRNDVLEHCKMLRNNEHLQKDLEFGRLVCNMPVIDLHHWTNKYPKLADYSDPKGRRAFWLKFLASSDGAPYLVRRKKDGRV